MWHWLWISSVFYPGQDVVTQLWDFLGFYPLQGPTTSLLHSASEREDEGVLFLPRSADALMGHSHVQKRPLRGG
jgi:hypothetical protein